ncbi:ATP-binding protein [Streptosporangium sp. NBC_01495]|uniref:ATP-binding protein n=1 Tax=Streptosporangium sp. NBC_01495 TaxID=2903899 RepID=UPI002E34C709|nr:ATP-binding protein [Streptosporangium sp. NBC_01495]
MTVLPVERPGPMHSPFHPDLDAADHLSLDANELWLAAQPASASQARDFTRAQLRTWGLEELTDLCVLVVSEMTTNAIKATATPSIPYGYARPPADHPHTSDHPPGRARARTAGPYPILLRLRLTTGGLFAEVWDSCDGSPEIAEAGEDDESGRGLRLVGMCTDEWGHYPSPDGGKVVFGRWALPSAWHTPAVAPPRLYAYSSRGRAARG